MFSRREQKKRAILKLLDRSIVLRPKYALARLTSAKGAANAAPTPPSAPPEPAAPQSRS